MRHGQSGGGDAETETSPPLCQPRGGVTLGASKLPALEERQMPLSSRQGGAQALPGTLGAGAVSRLHPQREEKEKGVRARKLAPGPRFPQRSLAAPSGKEGLPILRFKSKWSKEARGRKSPFSFAEGRLTPLVSNCLA